MKDTTIIVAVITAGASIITACIVRYLENRAKLEQALREKKIPVYERVIKLTREMIINDKVKPPNELFDILNEVATWSSANVFNTFTRLHGVIQGTSPLRNYDTVKNRHFFRNRDFNQATLSFFLFSKLLSEIRIDLGHKDITVKFVSDRNRVIEYDIYNEMSASYFGKDFMGKIQQCAEPDREN